MRRVTDRGMTEIKVQGVKSVKLRSRRTGGKIEEEEDER